MVTINDVSRVANVSKSVVSKVLNNRPDVGEDTRRAVMGIVEKLGYIPNKSARELSLGKSMDVAIILPSDNIVYLHLLLSVYRQLSSRGYGVELHVTDHKKKRENEIFLSIKAKYLSGLIYFSSAEDELSTLEHIRAIGIPTVILGEGRGFGDFPRVFCLESDMADLLANEMKCANFENIFCINLPEEEPYQRNRNLRMRNAFSNAGFDLNKISFLKTQEISIDEGFRAASIIKSCGSMALCVLSNIFAKGVLGFINNSCERNYKLFVLGDMSEFDGIGFDYTYTSLPVYELAERAVSVLLDGGEAVSHIKPNRRDSCALFH